MGGEALTFVSFLQLDEESYNMAWQILDRNYESRKKVMTHIIKQILALSTRPTSKDDNPLRTFRSEFEQAYGNLFLQKVTWEQIFVQLVVSDHFHVL